MPRSASLAPRCISQPRRTLRVPQALEAQPGGRGQPCKPPSPALGNRSAHPRAAFCKTWVKCTVGGVRGSPPIGVGARAAADFVPCPEGVPPPPPGLGGCSEPPPGPGQAGPGRGVGWCPLGIATQAAAPPRGGWAGRPGVLSLSLPPRLRPHFPLPERCAAPSGLGMGGGKVPAEDTGAGCSTWGAPRALLPRSCDVNKQEPLVHHHKRCVLGYRPGSLTPLQGGQFCRGSLQWGTGAVDGGAELEAPGTWQKFGTRMLETHVPKNPQGAGGGRVGSRGHLF